ncbi:hypothetical protein [Candidatus Flexifilum breve]|uniref:hypothetical protein n=1 Tax=Candidatus Flexifilum breve TaxID=3140694 RepID=UPI0031CC66F4
MPQDWSGTRSIVHMTSRNLWDWHYESTLSLSSNRVIDAAVIRSAKRALAHVVQGRSQPRVPMLPTVTTCITGRCAAR